MDKAKECRSARKAGKCVLATAEESEKAATQQMSLQRRGELNQNTASQTAHWKPDAASFHSICPTSTLSCEGDQSPGPIFIASFLSIVAA